MRYLTVVCLSVSAAALLSLGAVAQAKPPQQQEHVMRVALPFGGVETIRYHGDQPPTVAWSRVPGVSSSALAGPFWSLGDFDRITAAMNREMAQVDRQLAALERQAANAPDGVYRASTGANGAFCAESVQMTQTGNQPPHIVRHTYGACGGSSADQARMPDLSGGQRT